MRRIPADERVPRAGAAPAAIDPRPALASGGPVRPSIIPCAITPGAASAGALPRGGGRAAHAAGGPEPHRRNGAARPADRAEEAGRTAAAELRDHPELSDQGEGGAVHAGSAARFHAGRQGLPARGRAVTQPLLPLENSEGGF